MDNKPAYVDYEPGLYVPNVIVIGTNSDEIARLEVAKQLGHIGHFELLSTCSELPKEPELPVIDSKEFLITSLPTFNGKLTIEKHVPFYHRFEKKRKKKK